MSVILNVHWSNPLKNTESRLVDTVGEGEGGMN